MIPVFTYHVTIYATATSSQSQVDFKVHTIGEALRQQVGLELPGKMRVPLSPLLLVLGLLSLASAQMNFFEGLFNPGGQQHQQQQREENVASDSVWYQKTYDGGKMS